ncbi:MAG TPA: GH1 family beta-glucosidase [Phycisphaerae bacterium]
MLRFPDGFLWGAATAAYQIEGAAAQDGRGPSIWDEFCHAPGNSVNGETGDVACDHYHRWREDLDLMTMLKLNAYRFSISWSRVMPQGYGAVNQRGLDFYDRLVDGLRARNIEPVVTLYHWDLPAALQWELGGWLHDDSAALFADYAELMFKRLGDRVKFWLTLNEPWCSVDGGYFHGAHAPGIKNRKWGYRAGHNLMRAHAYAVARYRALRPRDGKISFALNMAYSFPASESAEDRGAAERAMVGFGGWFGDPAYYGDYPALMRQRLGDLLPEFSPQDSALLKRSMDYIALNYYTSDVMRHKPGAGLMDAEAVPQPQRHHTAMNWPAVPEGFRALLGWLNRRYPELPIYITENGAGYEEAAGPENFVDDQRRIAYLREHIAAMHAAIRDGVDVRGYLAWSLLDNLEWSCGFAKRFGLVRCDFETLKRTIKSSGYWYARVIANKGLDDDGTASRAPAESPALVDV